jgi:hypothetical protein
LASVDACGIRKLPCRTIRTGVLISVVVIGDLEVFLVIVAMKVVSAGGRLVASVVFVAGILLRTVAGCATFLGLVAAFLFLPTLLTPPTPTTALR